MSSTLTNKTSFSYNLLYLREKKSLSQAKLADMIGVGRTTITNYERGLSHPDLVTLIKIAKILDVSVDGLINNDRLAWVEVPPFVPNPVPNPVSNRAITNYPKDGPTSVVANESVASYGTDIKVLPIVVDATGAERTVLVSEKAAAGYLTGFGDAEYVGALPTYSVPNLHGGTFRMFEVTGDSMEPAIRGRDIVAGRFLESISFVNNGKVHIVVTANGIAVKRVYYDAKKDIVELVSDNATYRKYALKSRDILELWEFAGLFRFELSSFQYNLERQVMDLASRLNLLEKQFGNTRP